MKNKLNIKQLEEVAQETFNNTEKETRQLTINNCNIIKHIRKVEIGKYNLEKIQVGDLIINIK